MTVDEAISDDTSALRSGASLARTVAPIERLPKWALCVPLVIQWIWLGLRYGSLTLPSTLNPRIETGGLVGESKFACLTQVGASFREWVAATVPVRSGELPEEIRLRNNFDFPLIAKPDIGWCGYGVRRIDTISELSAYHAKFPADGTILLQKWVESPGEAGLLYSRRPGDAQGRVTALTLRHRPGVIGDGEASVLELIDRQARMRQTRAFCLDNRDTDELSYIPRRGEPVSLTAVASTRVGARYESAFHLITPALEAAVDEIARSMNDFHYGRFDVKFTTEAALCAGHFVIIEINGAGSEGIQYWDPRLSLIEAFRGIFAKQRQLFSLACEMRRRGHRPVSVFALAAAFLKQLRLVRAYPPSN